ncbi:general stress protein [Paenibacillus methanolicus]|uniref:Heat induced stress protein YflT n=1 Tax=Paenibacillus methanolicus TaxID=582686 RepID=A0A5S5C801_9BACL|nr:general stress protein [Paenibacillus methanolicus]TYP75535.1 heat induced stress protein YflT [Paenibacillus methanolicus]
MQHTPSVQIVTTAMDALHAVRDLNRRGFRQDNIYVMAHDRDETKTLADATDANEIGMAEEGAFTSMANVFRSRGDEIRAKLQAIGIPESEAERYEEELDQGRLLVITNVQ